MSDRVPSEGSIHAPLFLIGEAPGKWEHVYGRPFVGPSFNDHLKPWWAECSPRLDRSMFFITNVLDYQPTKIDQVSEAEMREAFEALHDRIAAHEGPNGEGPIVIVPTGNYALYALTGKGKVSFHQRDGKWARPGITEWRGSILQYQDKRGRLIKVIPTIHPAAIFRTPGYEWVCKRDWQRVAFDSQFRELRLPQQSHMIAPTLGEVREYVKWTMSEAEKMKSGIPGITRMACSLDVETPKKVEYAIEQKASTAETAKCAKCGHTKRWHSPCEGVATSTDSDYHRHCSKKAPKKDGGESCRCTGFDAPLGKPKRKKISEEAYLGCIGYAWKDDLSLTVPTTLQYWHEESILQEVLGYLRMLHADPNIDFFGQNFGFDAWWCATEKMPIANCRWDLMKMHRVLVPYSEWHDLAFQSSLYTRHPYWKDEAKDPDSISKYAHNNEALWEYNGIDNCQQKALLTSHLANLEAAGRLEFYDENEAPVDGPLLDLSMTGIRADREERAKEFDRVVAERKELSAKLNEAAGMPIISVNKKGEIIGKSPSTAKMKVFLYEQLRLPPQYTKNAKGGKTVSTDVVTLRRLMDRFPGVAQLQAVGPMVLHHRRLTTIANFVKDEAVSADGRIYGQFRQDTVLGRLSCSKTPKHEGRNLQNVDRKLRRFYLPDEG